MITFRHLTHIMALHQHGNFRKAAASLSMSHTAFLRSIARVEDLLGVPLFDRQPTGVAPTQVGQLFIERGPELLWKKAELLRDVELLLGLQSGSISIAMGAYAADISGFAASARLQKHHPNLKFDLYSRGWLEAVEMVLARKVDLGLVEIPSEHHEQLDIEIVSRSPFVFFVRAGHPLTRLDRVRSNDFAPYPLVLSRMSKRFDSVLPFQMRVDENSPFLVPPINCDSTPLSRHFIREGDGVSIAVLSQIKSDLVSGVFQVVPYWQDWMRMNYGFVSLSGRTLAPGVLAYKDEVRAFERELTVEMEELWQRYMPKRIGFPKPSP